MAKIVLKVKTTRNGRYKLVKCDCCKNTITFTSFAKASQHARAIGAVASKATRVDS